MLMPMLMPETITKGVRKIPKPDSVSVCLPPGFNRCLLSVEKDKETRVLPISRAVAEVLIACGYPFQG